MKPYETALALMFNTEAAHTMLRRCLDRHYKIDATPQQQAVIDFKDGRASVSACPGSGKTGTGVMHVRNVATSWDAKTFHSYEMRDIFSRYVDFGFRHRPKMEMGGYFALMNEATGSNFKSWEDSPWDESLVNWAQNTTHTDHFDELQDDRDDTARTLADLRMYRAWAMKHCIMKFDDVLRIYAEPSNVRYLETHAVADHVFIDEFQDVNPFQFEVVVAMGRSVDTKSLVVVGDPNQSIYEWRGAKPGSFAEFNKEFHLDASMPLTTNFRSKDEILQNAETICNVGMTGVRGSDPESLRVDWDGSMDSLFRSDVHKDHAILCRYNRDVVGWQLALTKENIPSHVIGGGTFWKSKHIKMALDRRKDGGGMQALLNDPKWQRMLEGKSFRDNPDKVAEHEADARWVIGMTKADLETAQHCMQSPDGVRLSTIHKTKGAQFPEVLVHKGQDEKLLRETFVAYVAMTRAENYLTLG
ncbi:MAG TPA: ATP-dependent helicase [Armatimonadota bacterium]|nr:ATP-dependent helicase [Armatimonadota bacterium]